MMKQQQPTAPVKPIISAGSSVGNRYHPVRQSSIPMSGQNQSVITLSSQLINPSASAPSARQRQPMCVDCEKSLPNQIVFDKIESIIRMMQDEQNGLPVKTAKSFMSKIPSVFTGIDLIQWMMRNLKLEDQQEAMHLANLIASHGYIFPIEDHTLSIKNDCTFYRFQTPYLWPSKTADPENTDYAVYLCKRTMQGKTRLELADYEAENLARLQKMFSRKWEFIFMQAESQAKVDKKRDKLERKVLDSQERAFWDVYRPVPGCVNTTELDIKKACRLSKSAKRCSECHKVGTTTTTTTTSQTATDSAAPSPSPTPSPGSSSAITTTASAESAAKIAELLKPKRPEMEPRRPPEMAGTTVPPEEAQGQASDNCEKQPSDQVAVAGGSGSGSSSGAPRTEEPDVPEGAADSERATPAAVPKASPSQAQSQPQQPQLQKQTKHHHHHAHQHHTHHHHHHHHHPHQHGQHGHHHHHHHRQCPHHKHQQQQQAAAPVSREGESIVTTTLAAAVTAAASTVAATTTATSTTTDSMSGAAVRSSAHEATSGEEAATATAAAAKLKQHGSTEQFMRSPSSSGPQSAAACSRRRSDCNRMLSVAEVAGTTSCGSPASSSTVTTEPRPSSQASNSAGSAAKLVGHQQPPSEPRPASACCSLASLDRATDQAAAVSHSTTASGDGAPAAAAAATTAAAAAATCRQPSRKSSLHVGGRSATTTTDTPPPPADHQSDSASGTNPPSTSVTGVQRSPLKSTRSVCATSGSSAPLGGDAAIAIITADQSRDIGELNRELEALKVRLDRRIGGVKMSKVTQSYLSYFKQWAEYDPFIAQPVPSNPWISDSTELWDSERQTKDVHSRRVRRWAFSLKELLSDPAGREQFHRFLEKEFSAENLKFWDAVQELKRVHSKDVARRVEAIWQEYLAQDANCPINIDSKSYETSKKNMTKNKNNRYIFDEAAGHVYQLMKNDSYPRYLRSEMYKDYKEASEKKRSNQVAFDVFKPQMLMKHKFNF